jgi:DNA-directed RNA polymerase subunit RPC12/RpoP
MKSPYTGSEDLEWRCARCDRELVVGPVNVDYLGNRFTTELAKCPHCGIVLVSEELALGKMAEVEQILEGK